MYCMRFASFLRFIFEFILEKTCATALTHCDKKRLYTIEFFIKMSLILVSLIGSNESYHQINWFYPLYHLRSHSSRLLWQSFNKLSLYSHFYCCHYESNYICAYFALPVSNWHSFRHYHSRYNMNFQSLNRRVLVVSVGLVSLLAVVV